MNIREAEDVYNQLFIAFPHMHRFLNDGASPEDTFAQWCQMIAKVDYKIGLAVVDRWKSGDIDPPDKPWELGMLPQKIRAVAGRMDDERAKQERLEALRVQTQERNGRSGKDNLAKCIRLAMAAGDAMKEGAITQERNAEIVKLLIKQSSTPNLDIVIPEDLHSFMREARGPR